MKHEFVYRRGYKNLTVFFAGWGMDGNPFRDFYAPESDVLILYDYTDLRFEGRILDDYAAVRVVSWSLGVWVVSAMQSQFPRLAEEAVAVNGTPFPVDETKGVPPAIFDGTLQGLSESTLAKFDRRMCGDRQTLAEFDSVHPARSICSLVEELEWIGRECRVRDVDPKFIRAVVGCRDAIFPAVNQQKAWHRICPVEVVDSAHYDRGLIRSLVRGGDA